MVDVDDKNEWKECIDIGGVRLPTGYFFGASAATGDLSGKVRTGTFDNKDENKYDLIDLLKQFCGTSMVLVWRHFIEIAYLNLEGIVNSSFSFVPDNHDVISMKLYQLMVDHSPEEENLDWTKIEPSVSLFKSPKGRSGFQRNKHNFLAK